MTVIDWIDYNQMMAVKGTYNANIKPNRTRLCVIVDGLYPVRELDLGVLRTVRVKLLYFPGQ